MAFQHELAAQAVDPATVECCELWELRTGLVKVVGRLGLGHLGVVMRSEAERTKDLRVLHFEDLERRDVERKDSLDLAGAI